MDTAAANPTVDDRIDELKQVIDAYNVVTQNLQESHETLTAEVQRLQDELASANADLARTRRLAALGEMAAGIAHEVRNPLASIALYADMLIEDLPDRPDHRDLAERVRESVRGLDGVVNDVLVYARQAPVNRQPLDPDAVLHRTVDAVRPLFAEGVEIAIDVDDSLESFAADSDQLHRALVNLVRNACEAIGEKGGRISLGAMRDGSTVIITVADTGPGIDDETIDRIFNPFFTTRHAGTGLGLAIVHRIVDAHGGSIAVSRAPAGQTGAVFTITLPIDAKSTTFIDPEIQTAPMAPQVQRG